MSLKVVQYHSLSFLSESCKSFDRDGTQGIINRFTNGYGDNNYGGAL